MKYVLRFLVIVSLVFIIALISSCGEKTTKPKDEYNLNGDTIKISEADLKTISHYDEIDGDIYFEKPSAQIKNLEPGKILIGGISDYTPNGFLREVEQVVEDGDRMIVRTSQATIDEAFDDLIFVIDRPITAADVQNVEILQSGVTLSNMGESDPHLLFLIEDTHLTNSIVINGNIKVEPKLHFEINRRGNSYNKVDYNITVDKTTELTLDAQAQATSIQWDKILALIHTKPIVAGPVVVTPVIAVRASGSITAAAQVSSYMKVTEVSKSGMKYENDSWTPYGESDCTFDFTPPEVSFNLASKAGVGPEFSMLFYGVLGSWIDMQAFSELEVNTASSPWWVLYGGTESTMGGWEGIFGVSSFTYTSPVVVNARNEVASAEGEISGTLQGTVKDALLNTPLTNVNVKVFKMPNSSVADHETNTSENGGYSLDIPAGHTYKVIFTKTGYIDAEYLNVHVIAFSNTILEPVLQIDNDYAGNGTIKGYVYHALSGSGIGDVDLKLRSGMNNTEGSVVATETTMAAGRYTFENISAGNYTIEASRNGFNTAFFNVVSLAGQDMGNQNGVISPELDSSEIRIVLTWGEFPRDLDSHLTGPIPESDSRFHIYYANKRYLYQGVVYAELDLDDVTSYGPETVTIHHQIPGMYRYSIHDYTNRNNTQSYQLSNSSAQIKVWQGSELIHTFNVPTNTIGNVWRVFELYENALIPINTVSNSAEYKNGNEDVDYTALPKK